MKSYKNLYMQNKISELKIENLHVETEDKEILKGIDLKVKSGEIHALMGKNGSGKSTLVNAILNYPKYKKTKGKIFLNAKNFQNLSTEQIAKLGIFVSFQHPMEIPGVSYFSFLKTIKNIKNKENNLPFVDSEKFLKELTPLLSLLNMPKSLLERHLNNNFSGGEKKRAEILQMLVLQPKIAILDEIDSGLDIDALKDVCKAIKYAHKKYNIGIILITHYQRILNYLTPDFVHIVNNGKIIKSGKSALAKEIEKNGYEKYIKEYK